MHHKIYKIIPIYYLVNKYDFTMGYKNILEDDSEPNAYKRWILQDSVQVKITKKPSIVHFF